MRNVNIPLKEVKCNPSKYNAVEVDFWKKIFLSKKPIPSLHINERKEVIAFYSTYFILKELEISEINVVLYD